MMHSSASSSSADAISPTNLVLQQYAVSPEKGKAAAKKALANAANYHDKWSILVNVFIQVGQAEFEKIVSYFGKIPVSQKLSAYKTLQNLLVNLQMPQATAESLIPAFSAQKLLRGDDFSELYHALAVQQDDLSHWKDARYYYQQALNQPNLSQQNKHSLYISIGRADKGLDDSDSAYQAFLAAYQIEKTDKLTPDYLAKHGVMKYLLSQFIRAMTKSITQTDVGWILHASWLERSEQVLKTATLYFNKVIAHCKTSKNTNGIKQALFLADDFDMGDKLQELYALIETIPEDEITRFDKAICLFFAKKYAEACALMAILIDETPDDYHIAMKLAEGYEHQEKYHETICVLLDLLKSLSNDIFRERACILLSRTYLNLSNIDEAIYYANETLRINPQNVRALVCRIEALASHSLSKAKKLLKSAFSEFPKHPELTKCANTLNSIKTKPDNRDISNTTDAALSETDQSLEEIYYHLHQNESDLAETKALALFNQLIDKTFINYLLGRIYDQKNEYEKAVAHYHAALNEGNKLLIYQYAQRTYLAAKDYQMAKTAATHILQNQNSHYQASKIARAQAIETLFAAFVLSNEIPEGIQQFDALLAASSDRLEKSLICHSLFQLYAYQRNYQGVAKVLAASASDGQYKSSEYYMLQGVYYLFCEQPDNAIVAFKQLIRKQPFNGFGHYFLGNAYLRSSDTSSAMQHFHKAVEMFPMIYAILEATLPNPIWAQFLTESETPEVRAIAAAPTQEPSATAPVEEALVPYTPTALNSYQIMHRSFMREKISQTITMRNNIDPDAKSNDQQFLVPRIGYVSLTDKRISRVTFGNHNPHLSFTYAMLDKEKLLSETHDEKLVNEWQSLLDKGAKIVSDVNKQGIKYLKDTEQNESGEGYVAKLKLLGFYGQFRAFCREFRLNNSSPQILLVFDKALRKAHKR